MKKALITLSILFIFSVAVIPTPTSADTKAGWTPGNFFYFLDTGFEKINLFFIFNSEKKAEKALEYAEERLAEAEEVTDENEPELMEKALAGYEEKISLATEKSKEIKDEEKAEKLLNIVSESTAKHQVILESVLEKVPEEAKEAIQKAIEIAKQKREETDEQIQEFKNEIAELKKELEKTKSVEVENNDLDVSRPSLDGEEILGNNNNNEDEIKKAKYETETAHAKAEAEKYKLEAEKTKLEMEKLKKENVNKVQTQTAIQTEVKKTEAQNNIFTLPNGAIIELDIFGNIVKTIKEATAKPKEEWAKWKPCYPDKFIIKSDNEVILKQEWNAQTQRCEEQEWFKWKPCNPNEKWNKETQRCDVDPVATARLLQRSSRQTTVNAQ